MADYFHLSKEDCEITTKSGAVTQFNDRIGWARQYFRRALFIDIPERGVYEITQRGLDYLNSHTDMKIENLMEYPEYASYATKKKTTEEADKKSIEESVPIGIEEITPTEQLENAILCINNDLAAELIEKIITQTPSFFERMVVHLLLKMGYGDPSDPSAMVTKASHDDGIDGIIPQDKLGLDKIYIQAKRYQPNNIIGKPIIQQFAGALDEQKANKGVFITTSSYTKEAREYINKSTKKIVLIDGALLARYLIEYNVGVSCYKTYELKRIDTDYFEE